MKKNDGVRVGKCMSPDEENVPNFPWKNENQEHFSVGNSTNFVRLVEVYYIDKRLE